MKKKHIIILLIASVLLLVSMVFFLILPKVGYSSPENLLWLSPKVQCYKIYTILESNDRYLAVYKGDSAIRSEIIYEKNGRYFLFEYDTDTILWEHTDNDALVVVRMVEGKYTVEVDCIDVKGSANDVTDSLNTHFEYEKVEARGYSSKNWFAAIDSLPDNYYLDIDGEIITINPQAIEADTRNDSAH